MASVDGRIVTLPSAVVRSGRRWLVPVEFLPRALGPIYDQRIDLRRPARLLLVGDLRVPRVAGRIDSAGPPTRATIVITPATPVTATTETGRLVLRVEADALEPVFPVTATGLVDGIRIGDQPNRRRRCLESFGRHRADDREHRGQHHASGDRGPGRGPDAGSASADSRAATDSESGISSSRTRAATGAADTGDRRRSRRRRHRCARGRRSGGKAVDARRRATTCARSSNGASACESS